MASGIINFNADGALVGKIEWSSYSNGSTANNSTVTAILYARRNDGYTTTGRSWSGYVNIDDNRMNINFDSSVSVGSSWVEMARVTHTVNHNDDGSGTCNIYGSVTGPSGTGLASRTSSGGQWVTLDKIARYLNITSFFVQNITVDTVQVYWATSDARDNTEYQLDQNVWVGSSTYGESLAPDNKSGTFNIINLKPATTYSLKIRCKRSDSGLYTESGTITFTTKDIATFTQAPSFNIGEKPTVKWTAPEGCIITLFAQNIEDGEVESQLTSAVNVTGRTEYTFELSADILYAHTMNSNAGTIRYVLKTSKDSKVYTSSVDAKYYVVGSEPIFSNYTYYDDNTLTSELTGDATKVVKNYSSLKIAISTANKAIAQNQAAMDYYKAEISGKSYIAKYSDTSSILIPAGLFGITGIQSDILNVYAVDSRKKTTLVSKQLTLIDYFDLSINKVTAERADNGVGKAVLLKFEGTFWNNNFGSIENSITSATYQYRNTSSNDWITGTTKLIVNTSKNTYNGSITINGDLGADGFSQNSSFYIRLTIADMLSERTYDTTIGMGTPAISIYKNKVAIGQKYDTADDSTLQVNGDISVNGEKLKVGSGIPTGCVTKYLGQGDVPKGWLECNGSAVSRTTYVDLFNVIGTTFGSGDGNTTFNLPDMRGRTPVGLDTSDNDFNAIGKMGGDKSHYHLSPLTWFSENGNKVGTTNRYGLEKVYDRDFYGVNVNATEGSTSKEKLGYYTSTSSSLQPYFVTRYIIKY